MKVRGAPIFKTRSFLRNRHVCCAGVTPGPVVECFEWIVHCPRITTLERLMWAEKSLTIKVDQMIRRLRNPNLCLPRNLPEKLHQIPPCEKCSHENKSIFAGTK